MNTAAITANSIRNITHSGTLCAFPGVMTSSGAIVGEGVGDGVTSSPLHVISGVGVICGSGVGVTGTGAPSSAFITLL